MITSAKNRWIYRPAAMVSEYRVHVFMLRLVMALSRAVLDIRVIKIHKLYSLASRA
jgi:hypothetical protein